MTLDEASVLENGQLAENNHGGSATTCLTLDLETYFDGQYSLQNKKLPTEAYIRDERFEPLVLAYAFDDGPIHSVLGPEEIANWIADQDWSRITAICHNAIFDLGVLSFLFGVSPGKIIDTMALSRGVFGPGVSAKLKDVASRLGLSKKSINYEGFKGKRFTDLPPVGLRHLAAGCERDVELTRETANRLLVDFPPGELEIIDLTVRGFTEPVLIGDSDALEGIALSEVQRKASAANALGLVQKTIRGKESYPELTSSEKFTALLTECGVEVEVKDGKNGVIPAIAKTDAFMQELRLRSDRAGQLAVARLDAKSSLNEDRAKRLASMARHGATGRGSIQRHARTSVAAKSSPLNSNGAFIALASA